MEDFREDTSSIMIIVDGPFLTLSARFSDLYRVRERSQLLREHRPSRGVRAWKSE